MRSSKKSVSPSWSLSVLSFALTSGSGVGAWGNRGGVLAVAAVSANGLTRGSKVGAVANSRAVRAISCSLCICSVSAARAVWVSTKEAIRKFCSSGPVTFAKMIAVTSAAYNWRERRPVTTTMQKPRPRSSPAAVAAVLTQSSRRQKVIAGSGAKVWKVVTMRPLTCSSRWGGKVTSSIWRSGSPWLSIQISPWPFMCAYCSGDCRRIPGGSSPRCCNVCSIWLRK